MPSIANPNPNEGFTLTGDGDINHALSANGAIRGGSKVYDWESGTEGFTITGDGCTLNRHADTSTGSPEAGCEN